MNERFKNIFFQLETFEPHLIAVSNIFVTAVLKRGFLWERKHTSFFSQLVNRLSFVQFQSNDTQCTCLLQNLAFCDPKGKPPAELDKDDSIVTGFLR